MTVKSTISFRMVLNRNDVIHDNTSSSLSQYRRSFLASLKRRKKIISAPKTIDVIRGLKTAKSATPKSLNEMWQKEKIYIDSSNVVLALLLFGT